MREQQVTSTDHVQTCVQTFVQTLQRFDEQTKKGQSAGSSACYSNESWIMILQGRMDEVGDLSTALIQGLICALCTNATNAYPGLNEQI